MARVVLRQGKHDDITTALVQLHWLSIRQRVTFKIAALTFKVLHTHQPAYLYELIDNYVPVRDLRSSSQGLLFVHRTRTVLASRAFKHCAASIIME